ncbi:MAG: hypothetical protein ACE5GB_03110 [Acidimicrobiales bacterium]
MSRTQRAKVLLAVPLGIAVLVAACGDDSSVPTQGPGVAGSSSTGSSDAGSSPTAAVTELAAATETQPAGGPDVDPQSDEGEAMAAWATVFDSTLDIAVKAPHLEDADELATSNAQYHEAGESLGGISLTPTAAAVEGDTATITYDVLFGGTAAYTDLAGTVERIDGRWVVSRQEYCGFLASARTPCG